MPGGKASDERRKAKRAAEFANLQAPPTQDTKICRSEAASPKTPATSFDQMDGQLWTPTVWVSSPKGLGTHCIQEFFQYRKVVLGPRNMGPPCTDYVRSYDVTVNLPHKQHTIKTQTWAVPVYASFPISDLQLMYCSGAALVNLLHTRKRINIF